MISKYCRPYLAVAIILQAVLIPSLGRAQHLQNHFGRVTSHPRLHVMYWHDDWDSVHPPEFSRANINAWLKSFVQSDYFDTAGQYDLHSGKYSESNQASILAAFPLGLDPRPVTTSLFIHLWWTLEVETLGTGVPYPCDGNDLYVILLPKGCQIDNSFVSTCDSFGAYHLFGPVLVPPLACGFDAGGIALAPYAVIPVDCATKTDPSGFFSDFDELTMLLSHEIIEACTDPLDSFVAEIPVVGKIFQAILGGIGADPAFYDPNVDNLFSKSEAADIPEFSPFKPEVWHNDSLVAAYWSNDDGNPAAGPGIVRDFRLGKNGVPSNIPVRVALDSRTADVARTSFVVQVANGSSHSYAYPSPIDGGPGIQYVTNEPPATITISGNFTKFANYTTQYLLAVSTNPAAAATGNVSLTPSGFYDKGSVTIHADQDVDAGAGARYDFQSWGGDISASTPDFTFTLTAPTSAIANYQLQHFVTINTNGLGANITHLFDNGTPIGTASDASPFTGWLADGAFVLTADDVVVGSGGISYFFENFTPAAPAALTAPFTTTAFYKTLDQIIDDLITGGGLFGPGADGIAKSLKQKWAAVTASLAAGKYAVALNQIKAFINEVQSQTGKHITPSASSLLQLDALLVFHSALCDAKVAGQLNASQAAAEYGYYSGSVTALGGTPKPPCP